MRLISHLVVSLFLTTVASAIPPMEKLDVALARADLVVVGTLGKLTPIEGEPFGASGKISVTDVLKGPADLKTATLRTVDPEKARREGLVGAVIRNEGATGIWILRKHTDGQKYVAPNQTHLQPAEQLDECKRLLKAGEKPAEQPKDGNWKNLYLDEQWYKGHKQPEQVFTGTLQRHKEPDMSVLMRPHRYKLGDRFLYPNEEHSALEKLIGQKVDVRGKPYDEQLEGQAVSEIWPAAIRAAGTSSPPKPGSDAPYNLNQQLDRLRGVEEAKRPGAYRSIGKEWADAVQGLVDEGKINKGMQQTDLLNLLGEPTNKVRPGKNDVYRWYFSTPMHVNPGFQAEINDGIVTDFRFYRG
jgi:hypothetical protein